MTAEETVQKALTEKFPWLADKIRVQRARRLWVEVPADQFDEVLHFLHEHMDFPMLCAITGLDEGATFGLLYHLAQENGLTLNLKVSIPREKPEWKTIIPMFPGCELCEREIADLYGVKFAGLPPGMRYPLPDDGPEGQYPLRKDWKHPEPTAAATSEVQP